MNLSKFITQYAEQIGGIFSYEGIEAIPFNHWKKDVEWMVLIMDGSFSSHFIPVDSLTAREACYKAINIYLNKENDE